ncbi:hypothetical protein [Kangiella marina]|uniref:DUF541 domain-containing protein n=1 Tax=Kangiella marina TaxID=1079178 RepID=A0ABP8IMK5_9GAMM
MKKAVYLIVISLFVMPLFGAQLQMVQPEATATNVIIIKSSNTVGAGDILKAKNRVQKLLGVKLSIDSKFNYKNRKRYVADRDITPQEQERLMAELEAGANVGVFFAAKDVSKRFEMKNSKSKKSRSSQVSK